MNVLTAIKIVNALIGLGVQYMQVSRMMRVIQDAHEQGRDITKEELDHAMSAMNQADVELANAILKREQGK